MVDYNKDIGAWLHEQRKVKGYSLRYVAEKLDKSKSLINYWEHGERTIFASDLIEYCKVLDANPEQLITELFNK